MSTEPRMMTMPVPTVAPIGFEIDKPEAVQAVWDVFVKPKQMAGDLQSIEDRMLMGILRAVHAGLDARKNGGQS